MAPILGYWKIRGLAQPIRNLMSYAGVEFNEKRYEVPDEWFQKDKPNLGADFANLPYYINDAEGVKLSQSGAIIRHLARKHNLTAETEEQRQRVDVAECQLEDFRHGYVMLVYGPDFATKKGPYLEALPAKLEAWSKFLGDRKWLAGDKLTYVDFLVYEMLYQHSVFAPGCLDKHANLQAYIQRFEQLDNIKKYRASDKFIDKPFNGHTAHFTG